MPNNRHPHSAPSDSVKTSVSFVVGLNFNKYCCFRYMMVAVACIIQPVSAFCDCVRMTASVFRLAPSRLPTAWSFFLYLFEQLPQCACVVAQIVFLYMHTCMYIHYSSTQSLFDHYDDECTCVCERHCTRKSTYGVVLTVYERHADPHFFVLWDYSGRKTDVR